MTSSYSENRTNVRVLRMAVKLAERLAPNWVESKALEVWCRPRRALGRWNGVAASSRPFQFDVGEVPLAAWEWNVTGHRGTALLVHGWSGNGAQMSSFVEPLVASGFHVLAVDLPGHGSTPGNAATVVSLAHTLASVCRSLKPRVVIAHSMGATATAYALTMLAERPGDVVLLAPAVQLPPFLQRFAESVGLSEEMQGRLLRRLETLVGRSVTDLDIRKHVSALENVRALVVHDVGDEVTPFESSDSLVKLWPGARLLTTRRLSHDAIRREPQVIEHVLEFINGEQSRLDDSSKEQAVSPGRYRRHRRNENHDSLSHVG